MTIGWFSVAVNIGCAVFYVLRTIAVTRDRTKAASEEKAHQAKVMGIVQTTMDSLMNLPKWQEAMNIAGFLTYVASREDVPLDVRAQAQALLPLEEGVLSVEIMDAPKVVH